MHNKLTQKQENFTRLLFQGVSQRDAYIQAYHPTYSISSIDENASRLSSNEKVLARLKALNDRADTKVGYTVEQRKQRLAYIAEEDNKGQFGYARQPNISAIAELNKMHPGAYAPLKVDITEGLEALLNRLHGRQPAIEEGHDNGDSD